jgi:hypothetical protein
VHVAGIIRSATLQPFDVIDNVAASAGGFAGE